MENHVSVMILCAFMYIARILNFFPIFFYFSLFRHEMRPHGILGLVLAVDYSILFKE